jgi:hypothetical protein
MEREPLATSAASRWLVAPTVVKAGCTFAAR